MKVQKIINREKQTISFHGEFTFTELSMAASAKGDAHKYTRALINCQTNEIEDADLILLIASSLAKSLKLLGVKNELLDATKG